MPNENERGEANPAGSKQGLLGLPLIILRMILEELYRDDRTALLVFRLASRLCLTESDILLFRSVRISEPGDRGYPEWLLTRLGDPKDTLAGHVRHLQIGPFYGDEKWYLEIPVQLEQAISNLRDLRSLSWNTDALIPGGCLEALHKTCPTAQLHIVQKLRRWKQIDRSLLSSPQLHSLDMDFHYLVRTTLAEFVGSSELQIIKQCLLEGSSIKVLRLSGFAFSPHWASLSQDFANEIKNWERGPLNFHWQSGDQFPALQEFWWGIGCPIPDGPYDFSAEQSRMWLRCTDWTQLRVLRLGHYIDAQPFFKILTGATPQLRRLTFADRQLDADISVLSKFLSAITALYYVSLRCSDYQTFLMILSTIIGHHGRSLKELDIGVARDMPDWSRQQYEDLLRSVPLVTHLKIVFNYSTSNIGESEGEWRIFGTNLTPRQKFDLTKKGKPKLMSSASETPQFGLS